MLVKARQICDLRTRIQRPTNVPSCVARRVEARMVPIPEVRVNFYPDNALATGGMVHSGVPGDFEVLMEEQKGERYHTATTKLATSRLEGRTVQAAALVYMLECAPMELFMELEELLGFTTPMHKDIVSCISGGSESDNMSL